MSVTVRKKFKYPWVTIPKAIVLDTEITGMAKALYIYMVSKEDPEWEYSAIRVAQDFKEGRDSIRAAMKNLISAGWIERHKKPNGKINYTLYDYPETGKPFLAAVPKNGKAVPKGNNSIEDGVIPSINTSIEDATINTKRDISRACDDLNCQHFPTFWQLYDKKVDKARCKKLWSKLPEIMKEKIIGHVPLYVASTPEKQFRKDPATYLTNECWNNEIVEYQSSEPRDERSIEKDRRRVRRWWEKNGYGKNRETKKKLFQNVPQSIQAIPEWEKYIPIDGQSIYKHMKKNQWQR